MLGNITINLEDYITTSEYAKLHGVSLNAVRHQIKVGHITDCFKIGHTYMIRKDLPYEWHRLRTGLYTDWRKIYGKNKRK